MIDEADKKILLDSIEAAQKFGGCQYTNGLNEPQCVVGQIAVRVGVSLENLNQWLCGSWSSVKCGDTAYLAPECNKVLEFETRTGIDLNMLQRIWDFRQLSDNDENVARQKMIVLVEAL